MRMTIPAITGALVTAFSAASLAAPDGVDDAALTVIHNATIHTMDADGATAEAMAFDDRGRIIAVGGDALRSQYPGARQLDLNGRTVIPGLIDAHGHLGNLALQNTRADLVGARSKEETLERLRRFAEGLADGEWLLGRGWDQNDWPDGEFPTRADLDDTFPERPVWLVRVDGHAAWANGAAMRQADRDFSGDWQPPAGRIVRDAGGEATGVFIDGAMGFIGALVPPPGEAQIQRGLDRALADLAAVGVTGVHDAGTSKAQAARYLRRIDEGRFELRVYAMADGLNEAAEWACDQPVGDPSGRFSMRSVKLYADGALGSRGAALLEPYADDPGNTGLLFQTPEVFEAQLRQVIDCGLQAAVHAIGDRANHVILNAFESLSRDAQDNPGRHRIEHAQVIAPADIPRFAELGVIASVQPTHATSDMYWAEDRVGPERIEGAYAWRSLLASGARLALGSDFVVESIDPRLGLRAAVTRQDLDGWPEGGWHADEALTLEEALLGFTRWAAYAAFMEDQVGSLQPGLRADFVVLEEDPFAMPPEQLHTLAVIETWLDGRRIWPRPDASP